MMIAITTAAAVVRFSHLGNIGYGVYNDDDEMILRIWIERGDVGVDV